MPKTGLIVDPLFEQHDTGPGHPERPARAERVRRRIIDDGFAERGHPLPLVSATDEQLHRVHDPVYVRRVAEACAARQTSLDSTDTAICPESESIARQAAGSVAELCAAVARGELRRGFAAVRPPGHHAERDLAMGFCLFNNVAVAALHGREAHGLKRPAVIDFDVHHGNGTQAMFEHDADLFYASTHQSAHYPGTGAKSETGVGNIFNEPLPPGAGSTEFRAAMTNHILPALDAFAPDLVLISAGFDAHERDPLAEINLVDDDFAWITRKLVAIGDKHAGGRVVSTLEGGYDLSALASSAAAHVEALMAV